MSNNDRGRDLPPSLAPVLQTHGRRNRSINKPSGEPESLKNRLNHKMGDLVKKDSNSVSNSSLERGAGKIEPLLYDDSVKVKKIKKNLLNNAVFPKSVLDNNNLECVRYQPRRKETQVCYEKILKLVEKNLGDQQLDVILSAADQILSLLKDRNINPGDMQKEIYSLIGELTSEEYADLKKYSDGITDYVDQKEEIQYDDDNDKDGVAILLDDDDDDDDDDIKDESNGDEDDNEQETQMEDKMDLQDNTNYIGSTKKFDDKDENMDSAMKDDGIFELSFSQKNNPNDIKIKSGAENFNISGENSASNNTLDPRQIDAYWLQRTVTEVLKRENTVAKEAEYYAELSRKILNSLGKNDARKVEIELLESLDYENFDLIKLLLNNRLLIYFITKLRQTELDSKEYINIMNEMKSTHDGLEIYKKLQHTGELKSDDFTKTLNQNKIAIPKFSDANNQITAQEYAESSNTKMESNNDKLSDDPDDPNGILNFSANANIIDLNSLCLQSGSHYMTNKKCYLPQGHVRQTSKDYEQIFIPGIKSQSKDSMESYLIKNFPEWVRPAFQGMTFLNPIQTQLREAAFETHENILLCAPTGAGKTNVAMMCILHEIGLARDEKTGQIDLNSFKVVYIAPMKSLVQEIVYNFSKRLGCYGLKVRELSGDSSLTKSQIAATQILITTPEKWDIITRKSGDNQSYTHLVKLIIIDEIHLLHDERGPVLETIVARTIRQIETSQSLVRLVGLSATLPNYKDVAQFLRVKSNYLFAFKNDMRPIPLEQCYVGISVKQPFKRYRLLNELCYEKLLSLATQQVLIFVHSRKETHKTVKFLLETAIEKETLGLITNQSNIGIREILRESSERVSNKELKEFLPYGFAIHHAGMTKNDRTLVEDLFNDRHVQILVSTATLAWGVNLPAHGVIIKGTQVYSPERGDWVELSSLDVMQMLGRAGRPQHDTKGVGIVLTSKEELPFYLSLINQQLPVESYFISKLADNLNAEIVLGSIQTVQDAVNWLGYTYLFVRMCKNPSLYGISESEFEKNSKNNLLRRRCELIHTAANLLAKDNLIKYDRKAGVLQPTELGRISSYYYIPYQSMSLYNEHLKITTGNIELIRIFALSKEFSSIQVRADERLELEKLIERVPIPIKESSDESSAKINVLLQSYISRLKLEGYSLMADMVYVTQSAARIMKCLFDMALKQGWAQVAEICLDFTKMIQKRIWITQTPLRQFVNLPENLFRKIEKMEMAVERLATLQASEITETLRFTQMSQIGQLVYKHIHQIPKLEIESLIILPISRSLLKIDLTLIPEFDYIYDIHGSALQFWILVVDVDGQLILHYQPFVLKSKYSKLDHTLTFTVPMFDPTQPHYFIKIWSDKWIGSEITKTISFRKYKPPERFPGIRNVLDLQPIAVQEYNLKKYKYNFEYFNNIQNQVFNPLYSQDGNLLLTAAPGSGKTTITEMAIIREFEKQNMNNNNNNNMKRKYVVYICPFSEQLEHLFKLWKDKFSEKTISILTGEVAIDTQLLKSSDLVLSTVEHWDTLSRKWKTRKAIWNISLIIIDDLHYLGNELYGPTIEMILTRIRYMSRWLSKEEEEKKKSSVSSNSSTSTQIRFIAVGNCIANVNAIADWLGIPSNNIYNFSPSIRPMPLDLSIQSFEQYDFSSRFSSMIRPLLHNIKKFYYEHKNNTTLILFTPSRVTCKLLAEDLVISLIGSANPKKFVRNEKALLDELESNAKILNYAFMNSQVLSKTSGNDHNPLIDLLKFGIGTYHESMTDFEKNFVLNLYLNQRISVFICSRAMVRNLPPWLKSNFLALVGTECYEGKSHGYVEYDINEIYSMIAKVGSNNSSLSRNDNMDCGDDENSTKNHLDIRNLDDNTDARVLIYCHSSQREYYKKFLIDPLPIESQLHHVLHDFFLAEIFSGTFDSAEGALDYLTWTFYFRRLTQNPLYYHLEDITQRHISEHLSKLIEETLSDLQNANCIVQENEDEEVENSELTNTVASDTSISIANSGMIAGFYNIKYTTIELFNTSLKSDTSLRGIILLLCNATEFENVLSIRHKEDKILRKLALHSKWKIEKPDYLSIPMKVNVLLQAHFSRQNLPTDLNSDQKIILKILLTLVQALVDVTSSASYLEPTLNAMEVSQMIVQATWGEQDSVFRQLPHFDDNLIKLTQKLQCESIYDFIEFEEKGVFKFTKSQLADVASVCNKYPDISLNLKVNQKQIYAPEQKVPIIVSLERDQDPDKGSNQFLVGSPYFPKKKIEAWWIVIGDPANQVSYLIKRLTINEKKKDLELKFEVPKKAGSYNLHLYLMSDSWIGCDQDLEFNIEVGELENNKEENQKMDVD